MPDFRKRRKMYNGEHAYQLKIVEKNTKTDKIFEFLKTLKEDTSFFMNVRTKYEDQDFRNADAYFLRFEKKYEYYDDWNEELYNSFQIVCTDFTTSDENGCRTWDHIGSKIYTKGKRLSSGIRTFSTDGRSTKKI